MGGSGSVRGYKNNTMGPRDSNGYPIGGSVKMIANAELFFPVPFMAETKSVRLGTFLDAGALNDSFTTKDMKYSAGLSGEWLSPFGALSVSAAYPLNQGTYSYDAPVCATPATSTSVNIQGECGTQTKKDQTQFFQFNFGQNF